MGVDRTGSPSRPTATDFDSSESTPAASAESRADGTGLLPTCGNLEASNDMGAMIAALLLKTSWNQRETSRMARKAAEKSEEAAQQNKLSAMEHAADARLMGGIIGGSATIAGGLGQFGSGAFAKDDLQVNIWQGSGKGAEGAGQIGTAVFNHIASNYDQDAERADHASKTAGHCVESAAEDDKDARATMEKALDLYKDWLRAKEEGQKALTLRA